MFYLVESSIQLNRLRNIVLNKECFVIPILSNDNYHPLLNEVIALYVRPLSSSKGYMVNISHPDCLDFDTFDLPSFTKLINALYVLNKKQFLHLCYHGRIVDINISLTLLSEETIEFSISKEHETFFEQNKVKPITKIYEACENTFSKVELSLDRIKSILRHQSWTFFNNTYCKVFMLVEKNGLKVKPEFFDSYKNTYTPFLYNEQIAYTSYNLHNKTGRPTNAFAGVNFLAIKKGEDGPRKYIVPQHDHFIQMDYVAFHPTLISQLIGYSIEGNDIYEYLNKYYKLQSRKEAKKKTFQIMYSQSYENFGHIPFFKKTADFIDRLWQKYNEKGHVSVPISKRVFLKSKYDIDTKTKLFNYYLQSYETAKNVTILSQILVNLHNLHLRSNVILYIYDAILFDVVDDELDTVMALIEKVRQDFKLNITVEQSKNYVFT